MRCRYCDIALAPSHSFVDGEFCCEDHRQRFELDQRLELEGADESERASNRRVAKPVSAALEMLRRRFAPKSSVAKEAVTADPESPAAVPSPELPGGTYGPEGETEAVVQAESYAEGIEEDTAEAGDDRPHPGPHPARETAASWRWLIAAWKGAPRDLKLVSVLLPVLLVVAITGSVPKVPIQQLAPENLGPGADASAEGGRRSLEEPESNHLGPRRGGVRGRFSLRTGRLGEPLQPDQKLVL